MNISYIPFTIDLYDEVYNLWRTTDGVGLSEADSRENIQLFLNRNPDTNTVAMSDGGVVGVCLGGFDGRRGYIHHLAVAEQYRIRGIGRELVSTCLERFLDLGVMKCHIFIFQNNQQGIEFWKALGWFYREDIAVMSINL